MNTKSVFPFAAAALVLATGTASAGEVYTGIGFPGAALGFGAKLGDSATVRLEVAGGINVSRNGKREGLTYKGTLKTSRIGAFLDWYPFSGAFRLTAGATANDMNADLDGSGGTGTINGKPVDLTNETFKLQVKYARSTPFVGFGWGHSPGTGFGGFLDLGAHLGKFETTAQTTVVGKYSITQADVDAEVQKVRDKIDKLKVLPSVAVGLTYKF
jgi:hypothetical protein